MVDSLWQNKLLASYPEAEEKEEEARVPQSLSKVCP
jgi:hypothetical protein